MTTIQKIHCGNVASDKECVMMYQHLDETGNGTLPEGTCELCAQLSIAEAINNLAGVILELKESIKK